MPGHEVLTLQFGPLANYAGAHYWNLQDELLGLQDVADGRGAAAQIDPDVLFRGGETAAGQGTYTPRCVLWDLSGALGGVRAGGSLYHDGGGGGGGGAVVGTWAGRQEVHRSAPVPKSSFLLELEAEAEAAGAAQQGGGGGGEPEQPTALEAAAQQLDAHGGGGGGGVRYWTDYLKAHLHPRSVHQLPGAWHGVTPFDSWGDADEHWRSEEQREAALEPVRFFAEECDSLQGLQVLADDLGGFGGLAAHVLQEVRDQYGSLPIMLYALRPQHTGAASPEPGPAEQRRRRLNEGLSLARLAPRCSTFTPVAPPASPAALPLLRWQPGSLYHVGALCAAALDTATLPYRLTRGGGPGAAIGAGDMWGLTQLLTAQHRSPLAALSVSLPCPALPADQQRQAQQADARQQQRGASAEAAGSGGSAGGGSSSRFTTQWLASLTPGIVAAGDEQRFAEAVVLRGPRSAAASLGLGAAEAALNAALAEERLRCVRQRTLVAQPLPVPLPFPRIWAASLSRDGDAPSGSRSGGGGGGTREIASCAVLTRLGATAAFGPTVAATRRTFAATARSAQGQAALESWGVGHEEAEEVEEQLAGLAGAYDVEDV